MRHLLIILVMLSGVIAMDAQRKVSPVKAPGTVAARNEMRDSVDTRRLMHYHDENGNVVVVDTVTGKEITDTIGSGMTVPKMMYPLLYSASVGVDIWDPIMRIAGEHFGLIGFSASLNLHNRYIPTFEFGLSKADYSPDDNNYTYRSAVSPYFKIGCDYNIFYNSNPDYYIYVGLRYAFSPLSYQLVNVTISDDYWGINDVVDMPRRNVTVQWVELCLGLRVKIYGPVSMGWSVRYHTIMSETSRQFGSPYCVPGFGTHSSSIGGSFSIFYTLPLNRKHKTAAVDEKG